MSIKRFEFEKVRELVNIAAPADDVWKKVREFSCMGWHPAVEATEAPAGNHAGAIRTLRLKGGAHILEKLDQHSDASRAYTYRMLDSGPLPIHDYSSTIRVMEAGSMACQVEWSGSFSSNNDDGMAAEIITGIYSSGLNHLKGRVE